jgi:hypothetical protein
VSLADDALAGQAEAQLAQVRAERDRWKNLHDRLATEVADLRSEVVTIRTAAGATLHPPKWTAPKKPKRHEAVVTAVLSDLHLDEVVKPAEIGGQNAYDREIATLRLRRWTLSLIEQSTAYVQGVDVAGCVVMWGGDFLSGDLHDLAESNVDHMPGTLVYWAEQLAASMTTLADAFGAVHCPVVVGNHGRRTRKPRTKGRARDNYDWLLAHMVAAQTDDRVTFSIGDDADTWVDVYDTTYLLTHGDQVKGGGGIGGIWPPIMRMLARKQQRYGRPFVAVMGHWHQLIMAPGQGLIVNGSMKGYDEYAAVSNFSAERPQQAAWLTTPEHGPTLQFPIFCDDRSAEGW